MALRDAVHSRRRGQLPADGHGAIADCNTDGLQAWMVTLGTRYRFDRADLRLRDRVKLNNGPSREHGQLGERSAWPNRGEDVKQAAIGLSYSF